uniref:Uncharacterized protein n=1 Tax=Romanomermis culicivorax TaxID=13658 RepID=A0A915IK79_ROMCU
MKKKRILIAILKIQSTICSLNFSMANLDPLIHFLTAYASLCIFSPEQLVVSCQNKHTNPATCSLLYAEDDFAAFLAGNQMLLNITIPPFRIGLLKGLYDIVIDVHQYHHYCTDHIDQQCVCEHAIPFPNTAGSDNAFLSQG